MNNVDVAEAWANGVEAKSGHMSTDGKDLWSYGLVIGRTEADGQKVIINHPRTSQTTRHHINLGRSFSNRTINP